MSARPPGDEQPVDMPGSRMLAPLIVGLAAMRRFPETRSKVPQELAGVASPTTA